MPLPELSATEDVDIPGLGAGWTLLGPAGLVLPSSAEPMGGAFGRGGILRAGDLVLRPYRRGGLLRRLNPRLYASPRRFERELRVHRALWERGFPTVEPLACGHRARGAGFEGVLLTRYVEGVAWPRTWDAGPGTLDALASALHALAAWGLMAPDLNATNVHLGADGVVRCLDWDRAAFRAPGPEVLECYRRRMEASFRRLRAPSGLLPSFIQALERVGG
jgi:hypothetical protein